MTEQFDKLIISNRFRMYRYEVIGAYVDFFFSEEAIATRPNMEEDGYDDITDLDTFEDFSEEIKLRLLPLMEQISEDEYIESHASFVFDDLRISQAWGRSPSERVLLLDKFESRQLGKISVEDFLDRTVRHDFQEVSGRELNLDDIDSLDMKVTYFYDRSFDAVLVQAENIEFNVDVTRKQNDGFDAGFYVPPAIIEHYFGLDRYIFKKQIVHEMLQKEFLVSPAMILDADLFEALRSKVRTLTYEVSREK